MKKTILSLLFLMLILSACSNNDKTTEPNGSVKKNTVSLMLFDGKNEKKLNSDDNLIKQIGNVTFSICKCTIVGDQDMLNHANGKVLKVKTVQSIIIHSKSGNIKINSFSIGVNEQNEIVIFKDNSVYQTNNDELKNKLLPLLKTESKKERSLKEIAYDYAMNENPDFPEEVVGGLEDATVWESNYEEQMGTADKKYIGKKVYLVSFKTKHDGVLGPITIAIDKETKKAVGILFRD